MKPILLALLTAGLVSCARRDATRPATADDKADDVYLRKADALFAKQGESVPQETSTPILMERALAEVSVRIPAAREKKARIMFQGDRMAVVIVSYALPGSEARFDQSIQFFHSMRTWEMTWLQSPHKNEAGKAPEPAPTSVAPPAAQESRRP